MTTSPPSAPRNPPKPIASLPDREHWIRWLAADLLEDMPARLEHSGAGSATTIPLAKVFVDVAGGERQAGAQAGDRDSGEVELPDIMDVPPPEPGVLAGLLGIEPRAEQPHARVERQDDEDLPAERALWADAPVAWEGMDELPRGGRSAFPRGRRNAFPLAGTRLSGAGERESAPRVLLVAGPGQGKSTLVQQLCQLHRAALLAPMRDSLLPAARNAVDLLLAMHEGRELPEPPVACWPVRIVLRDFAAWLSRDKGDPVTSVTRFAVRRLAEKKAPLTADRFGELLAERPWLLVLDGLDEVPASGGRAAMLAAIDGWLNSPVAGSPHFIVATTRPQGYAGELGDFQAWTLSDLRLSQVFRYAHLLVQARHPSQAGRQQEVLERLAQAWAEPMSRRLLRSPLQVSMMAALVAEIGRPPTDRYRLFSEYYQLMYRRELERPNLAHAELLRDLRKSIDDVHRLAGFWLQVRSEGEGDTAALLSREEMGQLIHLVLERAGYDDPAERAQLAERLFEVAIERLVLLVHAQQDRYGFEIRSLQEMMAAEALMNGEDAVVKERLRHTAPISGWWNVTLFAAGKAFAQAEHLAAFVVNDLCPWLNERMEEPSVRALLIGSKLALDLLSDGAARRQRQFERPLTALALRLLELPPGGQHAKLGGLGAREFPEALKSALAGRLEPHGELSVSAWVTTLALVTEHDWAAELAQKSWPAEGERKREVVSAAGLGLGRPEDSWVLQKILQKPADFPPSFLGSFDSYLDDRNGADGLRGWFAAFSSWRELCSSSYVLHNGVRTPLRVSFVVLSSRLFERPGLISWNEPPDCWRPFVEATRFCAAPTHSSLAESLRSLASHWCEETLSSGIYKALPWPMAVALASCSSAAELGALADRIEQGEMGDIHAWRAFESRWVGASLELDVLLGATSEWPTNETDVSFPWHAAQVEWAGRFSFDDQGGDVVKHILERYRSAPPHGLIRRMVASLVLASRESSRSRSPLWMREVPHLIDDLTLAEVRDLIDELGPGQRVDGLRLLPLIKDEADLAAWIPTLDFLGLRTDPRAGGYGADSAGSLVIGYARWPEKMGILRFLALGLAGGFWSAEALHSISHLVDPRRFPPGTPAHFHAVLVSIAARPNGIDDATLVEMLRDAVPTGEEMLVASGWISSVSDAFQEALYRRLPPHAWPLLRSCTATFALENAVRRSKLESPAVCERLRLPPPPAPPAEQASIQAIPWVPLSRITLTNLRPFQSTTLTFPPRDAAAPPSPSGQWMLLVGENGVGKSTILRGLALTLAEGSAASGALAKSEAPYRGEPTSPARIDVQTRERTFSAIIDLDREAGRETLSREPKNGGQRPFVVGYGCHRGSALGDSGQKVSFAAESDILTLFDETRGLAPAESWLTKLKLGAEQDPHGRGKHLYQTVERVLLTLLQVDEIDVQADAVWIRSKATGRARLAALSDGYLTTAGWVVDMIARWIARETRLGREVGDRFNETMEGLVLLDEVDLHLHPRWQRRVLRDVKKLFPRLSFVVTTHQPLTLLGADPGEIFVLRRGENGAVAVDQIDLPRGLRADQVLTGDWFGLATTLDPETLGLLDDHRRLLREGVPEADPRRKTLEATLRARLGGFADTPVERVVQSVTAEILDEEARASRPEDLANARDRIARVARERLKQQRKPAGSGG